MGLHEQKNLVAILIKELQKFQKLLKLILLL